MKRMRWLRDHLPVAVWDNLATVSILAACGVMAFAFWLIIHLNDQRIAELQQSRVYSCERTYESFRDVFSPFFPKHPHGKQARDLAKFNRIVDRLKRQCRQQTRP